jgi:hypothetical protein
MDSLITSCDRDSAEVDVNTDKRANSAVVPKIGRRGKRLMACGGVASAEPPSAGVLEIGPGRLYRAAIPCSVPSPSGRTLISR